MTILPEHVDAVRSIVAAKKESIFFRNRRARNVLSPPQAFDREQFWKKVVSCLCSSMQKSGPQSRVATFLHLDPFPLSLNECEKERNLSQHAHAVISRYGLRFGLKIGKQLDQNLKWLEAGGWQKIEAEFTALHGIPRDAPADQCAARERGAARLVQKEMWGFGPKQSRNLWQGVGLTRYVVPLDSRFAKWITALPSTFGIDSSKLSGSEYYDRVESHLQALCEKAGVFPCELDAAVFTSADSTEWPEGRNVWSTA